MPQDKVHLLGRKYYWKLKDCCVKQIRLSMFDWEIDVVLKNGWPGSLTKILTNDYAFCIPSWPSWDIFQYPLDVVNLLVKLMTFVVHRATATSCWMVQIVFLQVKLLFWPVWIQSWNSRLAKTPTLLYNLFIDIGLPKNVSILCCL